MHALLTHTFTFLTIVFQSRESRCQAFPLIVVILRIGRIRGELALVGLLFAGFRLGIADVPLRVLGRDGGRFLDVQLQVHLLVHSEVGIRPEANGEHVHAGPLGRGELERDLLAVHQIGDVIGRRQEGARLPVADVRPPVFVFLLKVCRYLAYSILKAHVI